MSAGYETPAECLDRLDRLEKETGRRWSMSQDRITLLFNPWDDGGRMRDIACGTKRLYESKAKAKTGLKEHRRGGRRTLILYGCWYSRVGEHFHLGHPPGEQTYKRAGSPLV